METAASRHLSCMYGRAVNVPADASMCPISLLDKRIYPASLINRIAASSGIRAGVGGELMSGCSRTRLSQSPPAITPVLRSWLRATSSPAGGALVHRSNVDDYPARLLEPADCACPSRWCSAR
jgi:hypothetical protein